MCIRDRPERLDQENASPRKIQPESMLATGSNMQKMAAVLAPSSLIPICNSATARKEVHTAIIKV